jgi:hypothetical protein
MRRVILLSNAPVSSGAIGRSVSFQKNIGLRRYKTDSIPVKQTDPERQKEQAIFLEQELEPRLAAMQQGQREMYFVDAAHFVWAAFLGYLWFWERLFVSAPAGRQRFNRVVPRAKLNDFNEF